MPSHWDPQRYLQFSDQRLRPAVELLQRIRLDAPEHIVDLGCGAGNVTRLLAERWPAARVTGVDHSREMLDRARTTASTVAWVEAHVADWTPAVPPDLIFSNAALHWLEDHHVLLPRLVAGLADGGCLAVQMPRSWGLPSHRIMRELLNEFDTPEELRRRLAHDPVGSPDTYHGLLVGLVRKVDIWETEYLQVLEGEDAVVEWVSGSGLRPVLSALSDEARDEFLAAYREKLRAAYPMDEAGHTLYPFRRLFLVARC